MARRAFIAVVVLVASCTAIRDVDRYSSGDDAHAGAGGTSGSGNWPDSSADSGSCKSAGDPCMSFAECCSADCIEQSGGDVCGSCQSLGALCAADDDCCIGRGEHCFLGRCRPCKSNGTSCQAPSECCSGRCEAGACSPCGEFGQACSPEQPCCDEYFSCANGSCVVGNACTDDYDSKALEGASIFTVATNCRLATNCDTNCQVACIQQQVPVSGPCASCYLTQSQCIFANCFTCPDPAACAACCETHCGDPFRSCTGRDECPSALTEAGLR